MKYKNVEKEIIKALVKYEGKAGTIADALTQSKVLERHGVIIVPKGYEFLAFLTKSFTMIGIISDIWLSFSLLLIRY